MPSWHYRSAPVLAGDNGLWRFFWRHMPRCERQPSRGASSGACNGLEEGDDRRRRRR